MKKTKINYNDLSYEEKLACISLFPEEAKKDENYFIRLEAYRMLGFTEEAKKDEDKDKDRDKDIRSEEEKYFKIKDKIKKNMKKKIDAKLVVREELIEKIKKMRNKDLSLSNSKILQDGLREKNIEKIVWAWKNEKVDAFNQAIDEILDLLKEK